MYIDWDELPGLRANITPPPYLGLEEVGTGYKILGTLSNTSGIPEGILE
ncbi:MAG: hypothetical protein LUD15_04175 [Bacteroides sp.]|nr:hypothetical protein [Bacteroides sp.]